MSEQRLQRITSFSRGDLRFAVTDSGPVDGEVIVLLHGFPQRASSWKKVAQRLNEQGYRTIAPDQRGYSAGARPRGRFAYRVRELVADVVALIETVGQAPVHLVGHDWGACVAYICAARNPLLVRSLTTVSVPHPSAFVGSMPVSLQPLRSWYMAFFQLPALPEYLLTHYPAGRERMLRRAGMSPELIDRFVSEILEDGALRGAINYYRAMPLIGYTPHVIAPTTHVWSDDDALLLRAGAQLNRHFIDAPYTLKVLKGVSHWVPDDHPEQLSSIILDRVRSVSQATT